MEKSTFVRPTDPVTLAGQGFRRSAPLEGSASKATGIMFLPEKEGDRLSGYVFVPERGARGSGAKGKYVHVEGEIAGSEDQGRKVTVCVMDPTTGEIEEEDVVLYEAMRPAIIEIEKARLEALANSANIDLISTVGYIGGDIRFNVAMVELLAKMENPDPGIQQGMRVTSVESVLLGIMGIIANKEKLERANTIGDKAEARLAGINTAKASLELVLGLIMTGSRAVGIAQITSTAKALAVAAQALGIASTTLGIASFVLLAIPAIVNGVRSIGFLQDLKEKKGSGSDPELVSALQYLMEQVRLTDAEYDKAAEVIDFSDEDDDVVMKKLYNMVRDPILQLTEEEKERLTPEDKAAIQGVLDDLIGTVNEDGAIVTFSIERDDYPLISDWKQVRENLYIRMARRVMELQEIKENSYRQKAGQTSLNMVLAELRKPVSERLVTKLGTTVRGMKGVARRSANKIIDAAKSDATKKIVLRVLLLLACVIGIISFILANVYTGGAPLIVALVLMLVMSLILTGLDFYDLKAELNNGKKATTKDTLLIALLMIITIAGGIVGAVFSGGMLPMLIVGAVTSVVMIIQLYTLYRGMKGNGKALTPEEASSAPRERQHSPPAHKRGLASDSESSISDEEAPLARRARARRRVREERAEFSGDRVQSHRRLSREEKPSPRRSRHRYDVRARPRRSRDMVPQLF